jgi:hypothetical protein
MKNLNELLKDLEVKMVESQDDIYADEILTDIDNWLNEETEKQDYLEEKFRE